MGVVDVDVGLAELAGGAGAAAIGDFAGGLAADDRGVVGAVDGDGDRALVPSAVTTSKVSTSFSPTPRAWTLGSLLSSSYFQLPSLSIEKVPCSPLKPVWGLNSASPASLSVTSSLPPVVRSLSSVTEPLSLSSPCG